MIDGAVVLMGVAGQSFYKKYKIVFSERNDTSESNLTTFVFSSFNFDPKNERKCPSN